MTAPLLFVCRRCGRALFSFAAWVRHVKTRECCQ